MYILPVTDKLDLNVYTTLPTDYYMYKPIEYKSIYLEKVEKSKGYVLKITINLKRKHLNPLRIGVLDIRESIWEWPETSYVVLTKYKGK